MSDNRWSRYRMGAPPDAVSTMAPNAKEATAATPARLPAKVDLRANCSPIDDQGQLGSCAACAAVGVMEYVSRVAANGGAGEEYSRLFVYYNGRSMAGEQKQDAGLATPHAIASILGYGVVSEALWPYDIKRFKEEPPQSVYKAAGNFSGMAYAQVPRGDPVKAALASSQPVIFRYYGDPDLIRQVRGDGMMAAWGRNAPAQDGMGHTMMIVGYDDGPRHAIVRNSWGVDFGDKGYFYMPYDVMENATNPAEYWLVGLIGSPSLTGVTAENTRAAVEHTRGHAAEQVKESHAQMRGDFRKEQQDALDESKKSIRDRLREQENKQGQKRDRGGPGNGGDGNR
jgi:C1A family cysteine protease